MDNRAIQILFDTYWSSAGWKGGPASPTSEDLAYAKSAGVMFDPVSLSHAEIVCRSIAARDALAPQLVADGFLASLTGRRLDLRSALGSYAVLRFFPEHEYSAENRRCTICGAYECEDSPEDLNVLNFERFKWGGVRHDQPLYASFDLEQFLNTDRPKPTAADIRLFRQIIQYIEAVPPETPAAALSKHLAVAGFKSNKAERDIMIGILGLCGILGTSAHPGYVQGFVPAAERMLPIRRFVDMQYPACWWRRTDGINEEALRVFFGHVL